MCIRDRNKSCSVIIDIHLSILNISIKSCLFLPSDKVYSPEYSNNNFHYSTNPTCLMDCHLVQSAMEGHCWVLLACCCLDWMNGQRKSNYRELASSRRTCSSRPTAPAVTLCCYIDTRTYRIILSHSHTYNNGHNCRSTIRPQRTTNLLRGIENFAHPLRLSPLFVWFLPYTWSVNCFKSFLKSVHLSVYHRV